MPTERDLRELLARHPELLTGLAEHADEVVRIAGRIVEMSENPSRPPVLPAHAPEWERRYWARKGVVT